MWTDSGNRRLLVKEGRRDVWRLLAVSVATMVLVAACSSTGGGPAGSVLPPKGTVWFGLGMTQRTASAVSGLTGHADALAVPHDSSMADGFCFAGHLQQQEPDGDGYSVSFVVNGGPFSVFQPYLETLNGESYSYACGVQYPTQIKIELNNPAVVPQPVTWAMTMVDSQTGQALASGSVTFTP